MARAVDRVRAAVCRLAAGAMLALGSVGAAVIVPGVVLAQASTPLPDMPKACSDVSEAARIALPNTAKALRDRKQIRVLTIGSTPARGPDQDHFALVEKFLESNYKGLDVEIIDRGVSGELARDAVERIQTEVAINRPDVVFWQVGVAEAVSLTPPEEFKAKLIQGIRWLKEHDVDVVMIGMRYIRSIARDKHYQDIRNAIRDAQKSENIMRIGHYEAVETLDKIRRQQGQPPSELDLTDTGALCMADFLSKALAAKLFAKARPAQPGLAPGGGLPDLPTAPGGAQPVAPGSPGTGAPPPSRP